MIFVNQTSKFKENLLTVVIVISIVIILALIACPLIFDQERNKATTQFMNLPINSYGFIDEHEIVLTVKPINNQKPITASFRYYEDNILRISSEPHYFTAIEGQEVILRNKVYLFEPKEMKDTLASMFKYVKNNKP